MSTNQAQPAHTEFMDSAMRELWTSMGSLPCGLRLYGGTALALYLNHRHSTDFDFATPDGLVDVDLPHIIPWLHGRCIEVNGGPGMVDVVYQYDDAREIRLSFMECGPLVAMPTEPPTVAPNGVVVAHPIDLAVTKLEAVVSRGEQRDASDIAALYAAWPDVCHAAMSRTRRIGSELARSLCGARASVDRDAGDALAKLAKTVYRQPARSIGKTKGPER